MHRRKTIGLGAVLAWGGIVVASYVATTAIDGPRTLETGFRRLDVLARYHMVALSLAIVTALLGVFWRKTAPRVLTLALVPLGLTVLTVAGLVGAATILGNRPPPAAEMTPKVPTAPAMMLPAIQGETAPGD